MANRYWRGGTGTWNTTSTTNWAAVSGGAGGASVPTSADSVFFDVNSNVGTGAFTVTISGSVTCGGITISGLDGAMTLAFGTGTLNVFGSWSSPATNFSTTSGAGSTLGGIYLQGSGSHTVTTSGVNLTNNIRFTGTGTYTLSDALTISSARILYLSAGVLNLNNYTLTVGSFNSSTSTARTLAFGTGSIVVTGSANAGGSTNIYTTSTSTNLTVTGNAQVSLTSAASTTRAVLSGSTDTTSSISFTITNGPGIVTIQNYVNNITCTNFSGTFSLSSALYVYGNVTFDSTLSATGVSASILVFSNTSASQTFTTAGKTINFNVAVGSVGVPSTGTLTLQDAYTASSLRSFTVSSGNFDANNYNVTVGTFSSGGSNTKSITMGSGTWTILGSSWSISATVLTLNAGTSTISMNSSASSKTFAGGGYTYYNLNQGGSGPLIISGNNTFNNISNSIQPTTVQFTDGSTQTVSNFSLSGTAGNLVTINTSGTYIGSTLIKTSGTVSVSYCSLSYSLATGGATWEAFTANGNVDAGGNTGWKFAGAILVDIAETSNISSLISSAQIYNEIISELSSSSEVFDNDLVFNELISEGCISLDATSKLLILSKSFSDYCYAVDQASRSGSIFSRAADEDLVANDLFSVAEAFLKFVSETSIVSDASAFAIGTIKVNISESSISSDVFAGRLGSLLVSISENSLILDQNNFRAGILQTQISESSVSIDLTNGRSGTLAVAISENATIFDLSSYKYYWEIIVDDQDANWQNIVNNQTPVWANIQDGQSSSWQAIPNTQTPSWSTVTVPPDGNWQTINTN